MELVHLLPSPATVPAIGAPELLTSFTSPSLPFTAATVMGSPGATVVDPLTTEACSATGPLGAALPGVGADGFATLDGAEADPPDEQPTTSTAPTTSAATGPM